MPCGAGAAARETRALSAPRRAVAARVRQRAPQQHCTRSARSLSFVLLLLCAARTANADPSGCGAGDEALLANASSWVRWAGGSERPARPCPSSGALRLLLASVPRAGNGLLRHVLELATGVPTGAVYAEQGERVERFDAFFRPCGFTRKCAIASVNASLHGAAFVKDHFPFHPPQVNDSTCVSAVLLIERHPVESYIAWHAFYNGTLNYSTAAFLRHWPPSRFQTAWLQHRAFWHRTARARRVPLLQLSYEGFCADRGAVAPVLAAFLRCARVPPGDMRVPDASARMRDAINAQTRSKTAASCVDGNRRKPLAATLLSADDREFMEEMARTAARQYVG
jgi:hypothetical protein